MCRWTLLVAALVVIASCAGSADHATGDADAGDSRLAFPDSARPDGADGAAPGDQSGPLPDFGPTETRDHVMFDLRLPKDAAEASSFGFDFDNDGKIDNALGTLVSTLQAFTPQRSLVDDLRLSVLSGSTILLMRVYAADFKNHVGTVGRYYLGSDRVCCTDQSSLAACRPQAMTTCFDGKTSFDVDSTQPATDLKGSISGGQLTLGAKVLPIFVKISGSQPVQVPLSGAIVKGTLHDDGSLSNGSIAGGLSQATIDGVLIPELAKLITDEINDPNTSQSTRDQLINLFDANKDNTVSAAEVKGNSLVSQLLKGDVDVDGDGKLDLTLGVGFEAVGAVIRK
ncbi:MAG: hypothetical protein KC503_39375 [Myxococcales bacterium]|nr:hypothetical protein [Myxococcales bacterium]